MDKHKEEQLENRVSYLRVPPAKNSRVCLILAVISILLGAAGIAISIYHGGDTPLYGVSVCFSSILFAAISVPYGLTAFREKDKSYRCSKIGLVLAGLTLSFWIMLIAAGLGKMN